MGKQKQTRKFSVAKKIISAKDPRMLVNLNDKYAIIMNIILNCVDSKKNQENQSKEAKEIVAKQSTASRHVTQAPTSLFFSYNTQLGQ